MYLCFVLFIFLLETNKVDWLILIIVNVYSLEIYKEKNRPSIQGFSNRWQERSTHIDTVDWLSLLLQLKEANNSYSFKYPKNYN